MKEVVRYAGCFVCGESNSHGLKARFYYDGKEASCQLTADEQFEGYSGIYHGGIIATLLDEVMIKAILAEGYSVVTVELSVRYHNAVRVGDKLRVSGFTIKRRGRVFLTEGKIVSESGVVFASATGKYLEADSDLRQTLMQSTDDK